MRDCENSAFPAADYCRYESTSPAKRKARNPPSLRVPPRGSRTVATTYPVSRKVEADASAAIAIRGRVLLMRMGLTPG
jgi:hypothetical protein